MGEAFTSPEQFLVDKETELVAIVKVKSSESRWVILHDGDHLPLVVADCEMEKVLAGSVAWSVGTVQTVVQYDYSSMIPEAIAPPAIVGRRYVLWAIATPTDSEVPAVAPWTAHPRGFLLVRGSDKGEFVFWNGKSYALSAIATAVAAGRELPLDQIVDPARRLRVAEERMQKGEVGYEEAFIQGLLVNVLDAEGQAKNVESVAPSAGSSDMFGMRGGEGRPHSLWYQSLARLRDFGREDKRRPAVVAALSPVAKNSRPAIRLAAALALVDLQNDAGREALVRGFETESGPISSDPPDTMTFPGRYPYDMSSITACAHALARLGDLRGLRHPKPKVRLAAAEAIADKATPELRKALGALAIELEPEVTKLQAAGELAKPRERGDRTNRYPADWVRVHRLLARSGEDESLRRLVEAYLVDAGTYPKEDASLVPRGRITSWSSWPSPARAILGVEATPAQALARLQAAYGRDERWDGADFRLLRASLEEQPDREEPSPEPPKPTEAEIEKLLGDADPNRRAEGLAAAGYHQMGAFHERVVDAALNGKGIERDAAVYGLGFFGREVPEGVLRQLVKAEPLELRFSAIELATRKDPARFARETMELVRAQVAQAAKAGAQDWKAQRNLHQDLPRIVCRLGRGPIPQPLLDGLADPDPIVRRIVVESLELAGNPDAVRSLEPLTRDSDEATRKAAQAALQALGPGEVK